MTRRPGLTLIELLLATAIFALVVVVSTTVIARIQSNQRQILGRQRVVADGRYILETIARSIRQSSMNYAYYGSSGPTGSQVVLALKDQTNVETCYRLNASKIQIISGSGVTNCVDPAGIITWIDITPADLVVTDFHVFISPRSDPFSPTPRQTSDCHTPTVGAPVTAGYDASRSVCACSAATVANDCFTDQACSSTAAATLGQACGAAEANCICQNANQQPQASIYISTRTSNQASGEQARSTLQTTVTSHLYRR